MMITFLFIIIFIISTVCIALFGNMEFTLKRTFNIGVKSSIPAVSTPISGKKVFKIKISTDDEVNFDRNMICYPLKDIVSPVSILKLVSSFPRSPSVEDSPPTPIANHGHKKHFTYNRHGDIIPIRGSPWFVDQWFEIKAKGAIERLAASKERKRNEQFEMRRESGTCMMA